MAGNLKRIFIIGNLGSDPTMRYMQDGTPVTSFNVAVNDRRRAPGSSQGAEAPREEITTWFRVSAWRNQAETVNTLLRKGMTVFVSGDLRTSEFTGQDGKTRFSLEITMQDFQLLTPKGVQDAGGDAGFGGPPQTPASGQSYGGGSYGTRPAAGADPGFEDEGDIPF